MSEHDPLTRTVRMHSKAPFPALLCTPQESPPSAPAVAEKAGALRGTRSWLQLAAIGVLAGLCALLAGRDGADALSPLGDRDPVAASDRSTVLMSLERLELASRQARARSLGGISSETSAAQSARKERRTQKSKQQQPGGQPPLPGEEPGTSSNITLPIVGETPVPDPTEQVPVPVPVPVPDTGSLPDILPALPEAPALPALP